VDAPLAATAPEVAPVAAVVAADVVAGPEVVVAAVLPAPSVTTPPTTTVPGIAEVDVRVVFVCAAAGIAAAIDNKTI
jgi:hypothetical protein